MVAKRGRIQASAQYRLISPNKKTGSNVVDIQQQQNG